MSNISKTPWPELPTAAWRDTYATLHLWTQIVGKVRLGIASTFQTRNWQGRGFAAFNIDKLHNVILWCD